MSILSNTKRSLALAAVISLFTTTVALAATPPTANAGPDKTVQVDHTVTISGSGSDRDGSIVKYVWKRTDNNSIVSNSKSFNFTPSGTRTKTFVLTVTDEQGSRASDTMLLYVTKDPVEGGNTPPTANAGADKTVQVNNPITILGSANDSDGSIVKYEWKRMDNNSIVSNTKSFKITPSGTRAKTFMFTVTDDQGKTASDTMVLTVTKDPVVEGSQTGTTSPTNTPPTADAGPDKTVQVNHTITILGSGSDSDGGIVKYAWRKQGETRILSNSESLDFTPSGTIPKIFVFTVTDDEGKTASDTMTLTITKDSVTGNTSAAVAGANSPYLEPVNLPKCDPYNPEVQFIETNADWKTINNSSKRIFCVYPGDYTSLNNIKLTANGTAKKRRYIVLNNGNDLHPGRLNKSKLANFALNLQDVSYWVIDRAASFNVNFTHSFIIGENSTHNIFNRMFTQNIYHTMWIRNNANYNTIQNSRFDGITKKGAEADLATLNLLHFGDLVEIFGTKVVNNEFINVKALRLAKSLLSDGTRQAANYQGTIFDNNTVEFDNTIRTDCNGNYTLNGQCMGIEAMALGTKAGSNDSTKPYIVSNNKIWGGLPSDPTFKNLSSKGGFINAYMGAKNIHILNNVVFNTTRGIQVADGYDTKFGTKNIIIKNNLLYKLGKNSKTFPTSQYAGVDNRFEKNTIIDSVGKYASIGYNKNLYFANNTIINPGSTDVMYEANMAKPKGFDTNNIYDTATKAGFTSDYSFTTDRFTNNPRVITLKNVVKSN